MENKQMENGSAYLVPESWLLPTRITKQKYSDGWDARIEHGGNVTIIHYSGAEPTEEQIVTDYLSRQSQGEPEPDIPVPEPEPE